MKIIDPHHHLWDLDTNYYPWLSDPPDDPRAKATLALRSNYLLDDFRADGANQQVVKSVHVQAEFDPANSVAESAWLQKIADAPGSGGFPHGIVAYADLSAPTVERVLAGHSEHANVRGIRHSLNWHENEALRMAEHDFLAMDAWQGNFALLRKYDFSFDMQLLYGQMEAGADLARRHPDVQVILDHTGMPIERHDDAIRGWRAGMKTLAECDNISVKISGLGMSAQGFDVEKIRPFVMETLELFGIERCMFASNFPVDKMMVDYDTLWNTFKTFTEGFSASERVALFHDNAERVYRI